MVLHRQLFLGIIFSSFENVLAVKLKKLDCLKLQATLMSISGW